MKQILAIISLAFLLIGCGRSERTQQTALAQTEAAQPTATYTALPSDTPTLTPSPTFSLTPSLTPTETPEPTGTPTQTPSGTPTPTPDLRVIAVEPAEFLISYDDLPVEAAYFLPDSTWISQHPNSEVIAAWGEEAGQAYLEKTGRIDGWWVRFYKGAQEVTAPEVIYQNIVQYKTSQGAQLTITDYNCIARQECDEYTFVERDYADLGDVTIGMLSKEMQPEGENIVWYYIQTAYRNYVSNIYGLGWEKDVDFETVEDIARIALEKLKAAPLVDEVP
jgi:hypothetical protein